MLGWSSLSATKPKGGRRRWRKKEGRLKKQREGKAWRADPWYSHSPKKRKLHLAKTPRRVKSITYTWKERQLNPNRPWVLWLFCRELRSHPYYMQELVWSFYCSSLHGQLGFAVQAPRARLSLPHTNTHSYRNANPSATMTFSLSFSVTSSGFQNRSLTILSTFTTAFGLQNLLDTFTFHLTKSELRDQKEINQHLAGGGYLFPSCLYWY